MAFSAAGVVAIVGSGLIGQSWGMLFASGGFKVKLYDIEQQQVTKALENIRRKRNWHNYLPCSRKEMKLLEQAGSLKGSLSAEEQLSLIRGCASVEEAVEGAMHIQHGRTFHPRMTLKLKMQKATWSVRHLLLTRPQRASSSQCP
uniref:3-hydroxyacyl-CoA dehydrogenase NAD binding domain-containing protein n=1 Tax=Equus caballus TaxID=9796 RepID=A0A3Q2LSP0_HORSE